MDAFTEQRLFDWFAAYTARFTMDDPLDRSNLALKAEHTRAVVREITAIAQSEGLPPADIRLARVAALFHDVGRFAQYARYRTFSDRHSVNHAAQSLRDLNREGVLAGLPTNERNLLVYAVAHHNTRLGPVRGTPRQIALGRMLRDADKLDIYRVVLGYYLDKDKQTNHAVELGLPDEPRMSPEVIEDLLAGRVVRMQYLRTLNDFKLFQLGWIYDIHHALAFREILRRDYLGTLRGLLPDTPETDAVFRVVDETVRRRLRLENREAAG